MRALFNSICCCCRKFKQKGRRFHKSNRELFESGKKRIEQYLDVVPMIKFHHQMKIIMETMLTEKQKLLLSFQNRMLINELVEEDTKEV